MRLVENAREGEKKALEASLYDALKERRNDSAYISLKKATGIDCTLEIVPRETIDQDGLPKATLYLIRGSILPREIQKMKNVVDREIALREVVLGALAIEELEHQIKEFTPVNGIRAIKRAGFDANLYPTGEIRATRLTENYNPVNAGLVTALQRKVSIRREIIEEMSKEESIKKSELGEHKQPDNNISELGTIVEDEQSDVFSLKERLAKLNVDLNRVDEKLIGTEITLTNNNKLVLEKDEQGNAVLLYLTKGKLPDEFNPGIGDEESSLRKKILLRETYLNNVAKKQLDTNLRRFPGDKVEIEIGRAKFEVTIGANGEIFVDEPSLLADLNPVAHNISDAEKLSREVRLRELVLKTLEVNLADVQQYNEILKTSLKEESSNWKNIKSFDVGGGIRTQVGLGVDFVSPSKNKSPYKQALSDRDYLTESLRKANEYNVKEEEVNLKASYKSQQDVFSNFYNQIDSHDWIYLQTNPKVPMMPELYVKISSDGKLFIHPNYLDNIPDSLKLTADDQRSDIQKKVHLRDYIIVRLCDEIGLEIPLSLRGNDRVVTPGMEKCTPKKSSAPSLAGSRVVDNNGRVITFC